MLTNIENDHLASDDDLPHLVNAFAEFLKKLPDDGLAVVGVDNALSASLATVKLPARTVTVGLLPNAEIHAANVRYPELGATFDAIAGNVCLGSVELTVPAAINVQNALAAIAVARELGVPFAKIASGLRAFRGVRRRFDILARDARMTVVDDYAHHPTAVRATIAAARGYHRGPIVAAFQPHRYSRTQHLAKDFADALRGADAVYLAPVCAASEAPIRGIANARSANRLVAFGQRVSYVDDVKDLASRIYAEAPAGALVLMLGAGNITEVAADLADRVLAAAKAPV